MRRLASVANSTFSRSELITLRVADQLGIMTNRLYVWAGEYRPLGRGAGAPQTPEQLQRENAAPREEVERLREQREILKKSLGILSELPLRSMPQSKR